MKRIRLYALAIIAFSIISTACNKTKQHSKWLTGETWKVNEVSIDGAGFDILPQLTFDNCNIYDEICFGTLQIENSGAASFAWQVREKGTIFELSDQSQTVDENNEDAVSFSSSFSGVYKVNDADKKNLEIESDNCKRYPGKKVILKLSKQ
jgi:hypothetical protein